MGQNSRIGWTNHTFNALRGCVRVLGSPACEAEDGGVACYAEAMARRNPKLLGEWGPTAPRVFANDKYWAQAEKWNRAAEDAGAVALVFTSAMGDWFEGVSEPCARCEGTGRAVRMDPASGPCPDCGYTGWVERRDGVRPDYVPHLLRLWKVIAATPWLRWQVLTKRPWNMARWAREHGWPANAWAGTTAETQELYDERATALREVPAGVRFVSMEPLVQRVVPDLTGIAWVIVGCASAGPRADHRRPLDERWVRVIRDACIAAKVPFFNKQGAADGRIVHGPELDGETWLQFPAEAA